MTRPRRRWALFLWAAILSAGVAAPAEAEKVFAPEGIGTGGYDPVSYFAGGAPRALPAAIWRVLRLCRRQGRARADRSRGVLRGQRQTLFQL